MKVRGGGRARGPSRRSARPRAGWPVRGEERGDAAGWSLVTAMTVALVLVLWAIAEEQISALVREAFAQFEVG